MGVPAADHGKAGTQRNISFILYPWYRYRFVDIVSISWTSLLNPWYLYFTLDITILHYIYIAIPASAKIARTLLHCTALHCTALHCTHRTVKDSAELHCSRLLRQNQYPNGCMNTFYRSSIPGHNSKKGLRYKLILF